MGARALPCSLKPPLGRAPHWHECRNSVGALFRTAPCRLFSGVLLHASRVVSAVHPRSFSGSHTPWPVFTPNRLRTSSRPLEGPSGRSPTEVPRQSMENRSKGALKPLCGPATAAPAHSARIARTARGWSSDAVTPLRRLCHALQQRSERSLMRAAFVLTAAFRLPSAPAAHALPTPKGAGGVLPR